MNSCRKMWIFKILLIVSVESIARIDSLETAEPEYSLKPRNFNPHPYLHGIHQRTNNGNAPIQKRADQGIYNQGPIQFPSTNDDTRENTNGYTENNLNNLPNPYEQLSRKSQEIRQSQNPNEFSKKHYAFSYTVRDTNSGDDFSHTQQQQNGAVKGSYKVQLPDGRIQIVKYTADNNGYKAEVSYLDTHNINADRHTIAPAQMYFQQPRPNNQYVHNSFPNPTAPTSYHLQTTVLPHYNQQIDVSNVQIETYNSGLQRSNILQRGHAVPSTPHFIGVSSTPATVTPTYNDVYILPAPRAFAQSTIQPYITRKSTNVLRSFGQQFGEYDYRTDHSGYVNGHVLQSSSGNDLKYG